VPASRPGCLYRKKASTVSENYASLDSEESRRNAETCYWALLEAGRGQGFLPYRVGIQTMNWLSQKDTTFWQVVREIKKTLDPHAIISPGRYV
jgi:4-cresol dehydrogenase (hydroxylating) flavoprotein subunit